MDRISVSSECLHRARAGDERRRGAILMLVLVLVVAVGAMATGFLAIANLYARSTADSFSLERATFAAESGLAYCVVRLTQDPNYFLDNPAPHSAARIGNSAFELESVDPGPTSDQWTLVCIGHDGGETYRIQSVIGPASSKIPEGIVAAGTGNSSSVAFELLRNSSVGKYDPLTGSLDINISGVTIVSVNGSLNLASSSTVYADVTVSGTIVGNSNSIEGTLLENGPETTIESIDAVVNELVTASEVMNDNDFLAEELSGFNPGPDNTGDFFADEGTYVLPAGTYRFRYFHIRDKATVIFDTRDGPTTIICLGESGNSAPGLKIDDESSVLIRPGTTWNGLLTVLGPNCSVDIDEHSVFGRLTEGSDSASYSRIIGPSETNAARLEISHDSTMYGHLHTAGHELVLEDSKWYGSGVVRSATLDSSRFMFTTPEGSSASVEDPGDFQVLAKWKWDQDGSVSGGSVGGGSVGSGSLPTTLDGLRDYFQDLAANNPGPIADKAEDVRSKLETALVELAKSPPDNAAAAGILQGAQADLQAMMDTALIDAQDGQQLMDQIITISGQL